jgi:hypothetical protein
MALFVARHGATLWATRFSGKLNGVIAEMTPSGTRRVKTEVPGAGGKRVEIEHFAWRPARFFARGGESRDRALHFGFGKHNRFPSLPDDQFGELFRARGDLRSNAFEQLCPRERGRAFHLIESAGCALDGIEHVAFITEGRASARPAGKRIDHIDLTPGRAPLAANVKFSRRRWRVHTAR